MLVPEQHAWELTRAVSVYSISLQNTSSEIPYGRVPVSLMLSAEIAVQVPVLTVAGRFPVHGHIRLAVIARRGAFWRSGSGGYGGGTPAFPTFLLHDKRVAGSAGSAG